MTLDKLFEILEQLESAQVGMHSQLVAGSDGALHLMLASQPDRRLHDYLVRKGFELSEGNYRYVP